jgi:poly(ADP-ribose) glycohydrolase ARH3
VTPREQFAGCLLGLALGDALGAPYEGGPIERLAWRLIGRTRRGELRWTDDTQMSLDLAESLIARKTLDADDLARRFAASYRWSRGYGPGAAKLLKRIRRGVPWRDATRSVHRGGSFGNGGAMRAPVVGLFYAFKPEELVGATQASACITHVHPLGVEGAVLIAAAVSRALRSSDPEDVLQFAAGHCQEAAFQERLRVAGQWIHAGDAPDHREVVTRLGRGVPAAESCVAGLYLGLRFISRSFSELHDFVAACGGDADTIGAMSGAIWGAANGIGALPDAALEKLEQRQRLEELADALHRASLEADRTG